MNEEEFKKIEKIISNFKDDIKKEFRHQIGMQSENFQHKLDIVVEGHQMLSDKLDRVKTELSERIGCVEHKLDITTASVVEIATKLDITADRVDNLDTKVNTIAKKLDATDAKVDKLDIRMDKLDAKVDSLTIKIDAVATDIADHRRDTEAHSTIYKVKEEQ